MGYEVQQGNVVEPLRFLMVDETDHITGLAGLTPTVTILKSNSLVFTAPAGAIIDVGNGRYQIAANAADANVLGVLSLHATAVGADPVDDDFDVVLHDPHQFSPTAPTVVPAVPGGFGPTFEAVWRKVRLYIPGAPVLLVRTWVQDAYNKLADKRGWMWANFQGQIPFEAARSLAVTVTRGSTTVTSAALFVAGDAGRQLRVGSYPIYTIANVVDTSTVTLTEPYYGNQTGAQTGQILDAYATLPAKFGRFVVVLDPINQRIVPWWGTQEEMDLLDPDRQAAESTPRLLVSAQLSTFGATAGQMQYEYWPKPTSAGALQYYAVERPKVFGDEDRLQGVLAHRADVLETGALAAAAKWPGTRDMPNPYFDIRLSRVHDEEFEKSCIQLDLRDDDVGQQSWDTIPWQRWAAWSWAYDTRLLRATDSGLSAYFGFGG